MTPVLKAYQIRAAMSALGHSRPSRSRPTLVLVRCYSDCVAKLFAALRERNNRIRLNASLNQYCVSAFVLKSMLLDLVVKIVLQHNPSNSGQTRVRSDCPLSASSGHFVIP